MTRVIVGTLGVLLVAGGVAVYAWPMALIVIGAALYYDAMTKRSP